MRWWKVWSMLNLFSHKKYIFVWRFSPWMPWLDWSCEITNKCTNFFDFGLKILVPSKILIIVGLNIWIHGQSVRVTFEEKKCNETNIANPSKSTPPDVRCSHWSPTILDFCRVEPIQRKQKFSIHRAGTQNLWAVTSTTSHTNYLELIIALVRYPISE